MTPPQLSALARALALALVVPAVAHAAPPASPRQPEAPAPTTLDRVIVEDTRLRTVPAFDTPASTATVDLSGERSDASADVSEVLRGIPGLLARDRQNLAQDTQLSIRGFGARATFGVRGLRLYADGIPASMPDGQGQLSHFSLAGADRIEVLRGPFSALHGNSSGGVVSIHSADGQAGDPWRLRATVGSDGTWTGAARLLGGNDIVGYNFAVSRLDTDGWRDHSAARRDVANLKLGFDLGERRKLSLVLNHVDIPEAQDPLGLTAAQMRADPRQAVANAYVFDTRKSVRQSQAGAVYEHGLGDAHALRLSAWGGDREVTQVLPIPAAPQRNPLHSGGVIDLDNRYAGFDARWSWSGSLASRPLELAAGAGGERQRQRRRGFENFVGDALGVRGTLRRDERNEVETDDLYAQAWWQVAPRWSLLLGARHSEVGFTSSDRYVAEGNPDDSGRVDYSETSPVAGVTFAPSEHLRLYASVGRGFETPTFNELSYRADGGAGLAFGLRPAVSDNHELGLKWRTPTGGLLEAALFRADTDDEIAVATNVAGRSSYRNAGSARRQGVELAWLQPLGDAWDLQLAATQLEAEFRGGAAAGGGTAMAGRIPGVPERHAQARLQWQSGPWTAAFEAEAMGDVMVNDAGSESAAGYGLLHVEAARRWPTAAGPVRVFARVDNLLDRAHIGSVIVNEGNGRFYEPGGGRTWLLGLEWTFARP
ncbi:TonB-dependent receptor [Luteimonas sp. MC1825]|uniref:TonB-dependent receptor family protein n=1 Tax=Luteimonas sp. MC1825 TaxID=2761107 RepID=UPI001621A8B3|nr:TonB-dependent receptor [Luteimonas sp. MC1825]MBB6600565.1 TonB-dependent receptor [Luteimonas sp. MC1825]QOC88219.1 TonB-dependent receptor [Luteimonas sp. MC1825]